MSRLATVFKQLKHTRQSALVTYITAGDPNKIASVQLMHALVEAGADVLELGVPFSDPTADGPVIQRACERALAGGTSLDQVLEMVNEFRRDDAKTPVVLMGYMNPIEAFGIQEFAGAAARAGVDGVITVDMPPEEAESLAGSLKAQGVDSVFLLAPTTTDARLKRVCEIATGFVYYVSLKGVTGSVSLDVTEVQQRLQVIRKQTRLPVGVGFGVRDAQSAAKLACVADAVVVGSAIVSRIAEFQDAHREMLSEVSGFVRGLRQAMSAART
jgi:tryptophan synthase alpha chain